jgi:hypothetical protein
MISSLIAMSLIDAIGAANISSSVPKRGVMFLRRAMTQSCGAGPNRTQAPSGSLAIFAAIRRASSLETLFIWKLIPQPYC